MIIYKALNIINNKIYIGLTSRSFNERFSEHEKRHTRDDCYFYRAIRKHGWENFNWEVIDKADSMEELNEKEIYWISFYDSFNNGYNSTTGGGGIRGHVITLEQTLKIIENRGDLKPCVVYNLQGEKVGEYQLISVAERELSITKGGLHLVLNKVINTTGNYIAMYLSEFTHEKMLKLIDVANVAGKGSLQHRAVIDEEIALSVKEMLLEEVLSNIEISKYFNIPSYIVNQISTGQTWKHISMGKEKDKEFQEKIERNKREMLSDDEVVNIRKRLMNGETAKTIARNLGLDYSTVSNIRSLKSHKHVVVDGYDPNKCRERTSVSKELKEKILSMYREGYKTKEIMDYTGLSKSCVNNIRLKSQKASLVS